VSAGTPSIAPARTPPDLRPTKTPSPISKFSFVCCSLSPSPAMREAPDGVLEHTTGRSDTNAAESAIEETEVIALSTGSSNCDELGGGIMECTFLEV